MPVPRKAAAMLAGVVVAMAMINTIPVEAGPPVVAVPSTAGRWAGWLGSAGINTVTSTRTGTARTWLAF
jgi:hypothetical protein